jgi:phosphoribosylamine---glycine ligase
MEGSLALRPGAAVGVVVAAEGYPGEPITGRRIDGAEPAAADNGGPLLCFHAGTGRAADGSHVSRGGRVVTFVGLGDDLATAREVAYGGVAGCGLEGAQHRSDIGLREL